jgi:hypothetical protein
MWLLVAAAVAVWPPVAAGGQEDLYMEHMYSHYMQQEARYHGHHQALFTFYYYRFLFVHCSKSHVGTYSILCFLSEITDYKPCTIICIQQVNKIENGPF